MSWEHVLAKKIAGAVKPSGPIWFSGTVTSPVVQIDWVTGEDVLVGPLIISAFGGDVVLTEKQISILDGLEPKRGDSAALIGNPFSGGAGSQKILLVGVISNVV